MVFRFLAASLAIAALASGQDQPKYQTDFPLEPLLKPGSAKRVWRPAVELRRVVTDDEIDIQGTGPPQKLGVEHVALYGYLSPVDREVETYHLDAIESTQTLELLLVA